MSQTPQHYEVAIIGAGVVGLSIAHHLAPHKRIAVLEAESQPAYHSSGRSAAMYIESYENPTVAALTSAGHDFFFHPTAGFSEHALVKPLGGLTAAGPGEEAALEKFIDTWQGVSPDLQTLDAKACREIVPALNADWVTCGAYDPSWMSIDVNALIQGFAKTLHRSEGDLLTNFGVNQLTRDTGRWKIQSAQHIITADLIVNAGGAWAQGVGHMAGTQTLPLTPMRRTAVIIPAPADAQDWPLVHTIAEDLYFKPESPGLMVCPQDETPTTPTDAAPEDIDIAIALDRLATISSIAPQRVMHSWAGLRTFAPDRRPIVGFDPQVENFFWSAGQGGFGVQTAPGLGQLAADCIEGAQPPAEIAVQRFG